jgi:hypothetical protein
VDHVLRLFRAYERQRPPRRSGHFGWRQGLIMKCATQQYIWSWMKPRFVRVMRLSRCGYLTMIHPEPHRRGHPKTRDGYMSTSSARWKKGSSTSDQPA